MRAILKNNDVFLEEYDTLDKAVQITKSPDFTDNPLQSDYLDLLSGYQRLLDQSVRLVNISDKQQEHLIKLQGDLQNILDNIGQGILTVDEKLFIYRGYSACCEQIFSQRIEGRRFTSLIEPYNDNELTSLIDAILNQEFFEYSPEKREVLLLLLPEELSIGDRVFRVHFKPISFALKDRLDKGFMIIMSDITEKKVMQQAITAEKTIFKTVTKIVSDSKSFAACIREYRDFTQNALPQLLTNNDIDPSQRINEIFREIHTLKGNFAVFDIPQLVGLLERAETALAEFRENATTTSNEELHQMMRQYDFEKALNESLDQLRNFFGDQWIFDRDTVIIDLDEYKKVEEEAREKYPELASKLYELRYLNMASLLTVYSDYTVKLAERLGKTVIPFGIKSDEPIMVDAERYGEFIHSLVHVFRNMVDHGIETPEERISADKPLEGSISCVLTKREGEFTLSIQDDGRGIDVAAVRTKAEAMGVINKNQAQLWPAEDIIGLIFQDGLTTSDRQNSISGRGVGLAAVNEEVNNLGGKVEVSSTPGQGTRFLFHLPYQTK